MLIRVPPVTVILEVHPLSNARYAFVACWLGLVLCVDLNAQDEKNEAGNNQPGSSVGTVLDSQVADPTEAQLRADIKFLASEELRGRSVTDDTIEVAASYLVDRMKGIGLKTDLIDGKSRQPFSVKLGSSVGAAKKQPSDALQ